MDGNPNIQREIRALLIAAAELQPSIRFCQHIMNALQSNRDPYYVEDKDLCEALHQYVQCLNSRKE
jgi:hypothetical protein